MSEYVNQANIKIGEMVRLTFNDQVESDVENVASLVMHYDFLKIVYQLIGNTINQHETNLANMNKERDRELN